MGELERLIDEAVEVSIRRGIVNLTSKTDQMLTPPKGGHEKKYCVWYWARNGEIQKAAADYEEEPGYPADSFDQTMRKEEFLRWAEEDEARYKDAVETTRSNLEGYRRNPNPKRDEVMLFPL